ncbi:MAG TPA: glycosyltransferase [Arachnia sp.]|nr:glycosyltransferase [Arachnia sp.]HMT86821.1 glycosyltransferase [Arachnia sp.]
MRATLASYGSTGDLVPLIALAVGMRTVGHDVVVVADEAGTDLAARHGLEFHTLAGRFQDLMEPGQPAALAMDAGRFTVKSLRDYDAHDQARLALIQQVAQGSDVVVGMPTAHYHALSVAREISARPVLAVLQPLAPTHAMTPAGAGLPTLPGALRHPAGALVQWAGWVNAKRPLNEARIALGQMPLKKDPTRDAFTLCAWSPTLVPQPDDWPANQFAVTGRWHLPTADWAPDPALMAFLDAGEPPIYVGLGSMQAFSGTPTLLDALLTGLAPRRIVIAASPEALNGRVLPETVHQVSGFVPHDWLFPRCAAVVHHCGAGTSHQAVASGVPSIPVPISMDQPFWANRLYRLGVAATPLNARRPKVEHVRQAIADAEATPVKRRVTELAEHLNTEDGIHATVARLEEFA